MIKKTGMRSLVVLFWISLFLFILYMPQFSLFKKRDSINVFTWGDILEPSVVAEFEAATGIHVNMNFYSSNEELLVKLKATEGKGYDMIIPSDYSVEILAKENLLKPLDHEKLEFFPQLSPKLLNLSFDPQNVYSIPFEWEIFLLGIDQDYFKEKPFIPSWKSLFDPETIHYRITMSNDPIQSLQMAAFYLFGPVDTLSEAQLQESTALLVKQKPYVNAYADFRADYFLATKNSQLAICSSSYLFRTMRKFPFINYVLPKEGSFITIENICIPKASQKEHLTYQLINYLYQPSSMKTHYETYGIFPAREDVLHSLPPNDPMKKLLSLSDKELGKFHFFSMLSSQANIRNAWVQVKTH
ncbi:PotD/PotF family extracellular solute-binding protein [Rhabdochlamydiaceae symbiont of Dictyostelium giganteum]|uniref:ABC transporter substrate-binding protein n=1 Tax=Rhabdochlamydiaceae symbiont of Dictyostelium giganteum TaxID=3342349 RepID=UPI00384CC6BA